MEKSLHRLEQGLREGAGGGLKKKIVARCRCAAGIENTQMSPHP
jgi:hypothetical protein